jgi:predicted phosphodiesterase
MSIRKKAHAWLDAHRDEVEGKSIGECIRLLDDAGLRTEARTMRRYVLKWREGEDVASGDDKATGHDTSDSYFYDEFQYTFKIKGTTFAAGLDEVQRWCRWYVYDGGRVTQRGVSRMALQVDDRILTRDFVSRVFKVLGIDKNSPGFAPHMLARHTAEELAKLHFAMAQSDAEAAIAAREVDEYKQRYREEVQRRGQGELMLRRIVEKLPTMAVSVHVRAAQQDSRLEPYTPIVLLSDWHVGALVRMGHHRYDQDVFEARLKTLRTELDEFFQAYRRPMDALHVALCGDMIDGPLGSMRPGQQAEQDLYYEEQVEVAATGIAQVIAHLRGLVGKVPMTVHAVAGNHGRAGGHSSEDPRRLPEMLLYRICEEMTRPIDVAWDRSSDVIHQWRVYDTQVLQTHGDRAPKGIDRILRAMLDKSAQHHLLLRGHRHSLEVMESHDGLGVQCGTLMGDTEYGLHQLALGARPSQSIIEVRRDGPRLPGTLVVG